jgi:hypothetical protein
VTIPPHQGIHHILCLATGREDPSPSLRDRTNPQSPKEGQEIGGEELGEGLAQKAPVGAEMRDELVKWGDVGQITAPLAGDAQLSPGPMHLLQ